MVTYHKKKKSIKNTLYFVHKCLLKNDLGDPHFFIAGEYFVGHIEILCNVSKLSGVDSGLSSQLEYLRWLFPLQIFKILICREVDLPLPINLQQKKLELLNYFSDISISMQK